MLKKIVAAIATTFVGTLIARKVYTHKALNS